MDIDSLKIYGFAIASLFLAGIFMRKFKHFFEWKKDDDWQKFWQRAISEREKDRQAQQTMFGSLGKTIRANFVNLFLMLCFVFSSRIPNLMFAVCIYLAIGFFVSRKIAVSEKTINHNRLSIGDRLWFRLFFAWTWPFGLWSKTK